jgi:hypothetical protein
MGTIALAMMAVYVLGRGRASFGWYEQLRRTSELAEGLGVRAAPVVDMVIVNSAILLSAGFLLLIGGVYLARQLPHQPEPGAGEPAGTTR